MSSCGSVHVAAVNDVGQNVDVITVTVISTSGG